MLPISKAATDSCDRVHPGHAQLPDEVLARSRCRRRGCIARSGRARISSGSRDGSRRSSRQRRSPGRRPSRVVCAAWTVTTCCSEAEGGKRAPRAAGGASRARVSKWSSDDHGYRIRCSRRSRRSPRTRASSRTSSSAPSRTPSRPPRASTTRPTRTCKARFNIETGPGRALRGQADRRRGHEPGDARSRSTEAQDALRRREPKSSMEDRVPEARPRCWAASPRRPPSRSSSRRSARPSARTSSASTTSASARSSTARSSGSRTATSSSRSAASRRVLPRKEQSRAESYAPGDRVRAVIKGVNQSAKGPQIVLSRTDPALLIKLFEQEVPGDLRRHGDDSRRRARGRRPREGRRVLARARRRPGRRVRRHEGHARAGHHPRAARREDRHRRVVRGSGRVRHQRAQPGQGPARHRSSTTRSA